MSSSAVPQGDTEEAQIHPLLLWVALLAGPTSWGVQLLVDYYLSSLTCASQFTGYRVAGQSWFTIGMVIVSLIAALVTAGAGISAWRYWVRAGANDRFRADGLETRRSFMALLAVLLCSLFLLLIVLSALPAFVSSQCATE